MSVSINKKNERLARFSEKYPLEYSMAFEIMGRYNDIHEDIYPEAELPTQIHFFVYRDRDTGRPKLGIEDEASLYFLGAISKTIVQNVLSQLESSEDLQSKLEERAKKHVLRPKKPTGGKLCPKCQYNNDLNQSHCGICGAELSS